MSITTTIPTHAEVAAMSEREHKSLEDRVRHDAKRKGLLLRRSHARDPERWPDEYGLYVLIDDCAGNRRPGAAAAAAAFRNGWGGDLADIARELDGLPVVW